MKRQYKGSTDFLDNNQKIASFLTITIIFLILHSVMGIEKFHYDSANYWSLSKDVLTLDFPKSIRGYVYPTLLAPSRYFSDVFQVEGFMPYRIISSLVYAFFFSVVVPKFYLQVFGGRTSYLRRLLAPLLVAILLPGVIVYPLSDLPAFALMVCASVCALSSVDTSSKLKRCALITLSGVLAYLAYNTRTIFLFPAGLLVLALALMIFDKHSLRTKAVVIVVFVFGAAVASIPQIIVNSRDYNSISPFVITTGNYKHSLLVSQLIWGITLQRYETSVDKASPSPAVYYLDKAGEQLFVDKKIGISPFGITEYLKLVFKNPLDFLGIYGRHIVNGLDLRDGEVYTVGQPRKRNALALFNFSIIFLGLLVIFIAIVAQSGKIVQTKRGIFWGFLVLLPVMAIIPGAIETRFFLGLHLAIYCSLAFTSDWGAIKTQFRKNWRLICVALATSATLFFSISTATMSNLQYSHSSLYKGEW